MPPPPPSLRSPADTPRRSSSRFAVATSDVQIKKDNGAAANMARAREEDMPGVTSI